MTNTLRQLFYSRFKKDRIEPTLYSRMSILCRQISKSKHAYDYCESNHIYLSIKDYRRFGRNNKLYQNARLSKKSCKPNILYNSPQSAPLFFCSPSKAIICLIKILQSNRTPQFQAKLKKGNNLEHYWLQHKPKIFKLKHLKPNNLFYTKHMPTNKQFSC